MLERRRRVSEGADVCTLRAKAALLLERVLDVELLSPSFQGERNLLKGIRKTLACADEATLCVAFASMAGVHCSARS